MNAYLHLTTLLLATVTAAASLIAIWAATSPVHWFWRALVVWAFVAALLPIRVYEPAIIFAISLPLIVSVVQFIRFWRHNGGVDIRNIRFGLSDIFLAILFVALSLVLLRLIAQAAPRLTPYATLIPAITLATLAVVSFWAAVGPRRIWAALILSGAIALAAWLLWPGISWLYEMETLGTIAYSTFPSTDLYIRGLSVTCIGLAECSAMIVCGIFLFREEPRSNLVRRLAWLARSAVLLLIILIGGLIYWRLIWLAPFPPELPAPGNNFSRIEQLAIRVRKLNPSEATLNELRTVKTSSETLEELDSLYEELVALFDGDNAMAFAMDRDSTRVFFVDTTMNRVQLLRHLSRCFSAEGRAAQNSGDLDRALRLAVANLRLATMLGRNSIIVDLLVGYAIEGTAHNQLVGLRETLNRDQATLALEALNRAATEREPLEVIQRRDEAFSQRAFGWQPRLSEFVEGGESAESTLKGIQFAQRTRQAVSGLLVTDLALRLYHFDHRAFPNSLDALVPNYLPTRVLDPYSDDRFIYRVDGNHFELYSVGKNRIDDGGRFADWPTQYVEDGYDLDLDTLTR